MYLFVPKLLFRDRYLGYLLWLIILFLFVQAIATSGMHLVLTHFKPRIEPPEDYSSRFFFTFMFFILMGASAAVKLFQRWVADSQRINELETNTVYTELENLKKQINPHFLFNTLNNVNMLTQKDPEKASQIIMKLSDLLRYQLYDSARNLVLLNSEIHFLEDFLNLEKIRRDHFEFSINHQGTISGLEVPPLLFITFIENAVKYSIDAESPSFVDLFFSVSDEQLTFHCMNSKPRIKVESNKHGGLGLANVKRRLELLYPGRHSLSGQDNHNRYNVELTINL
jgi:sensor histidine kinase YesM